ncbi:hypothetical protein ACJJTC_002167 [Scirpophaga incertulas]
MFGAEYAWLVAGAPPRIRGAPPCARAQLASALEGLVTVTAHRGIVGDDTSYSGLTNEMFIQEMENEGVTVSAFAPHTYDAVWAIALALSKAENLWRNVDFDGNGTDREKLGLGQFDYDRKDMAEEFLNQLANLSFVGVSVSINNFVLTKASLKLFVNETFCIQLHCGDFHSLQDFAIITTTISRD